MQRSRKRGKGRQVTVERGCRTDEETDIKNMMHWIKLLIISSALYMKKQTMMGKCVPNTDEPDNKYLMGKSTVDTPIIPDLPALWHLLMGGQVRHSLCVGDLSLIVTPEGSV